MRGLVRRGAEILRLREPRPQTYDDLVRLRSPRYRKPILFGAAGNARVGAAVAAGPPTMIARLGAVELSCTAFFVQHREGNRKRPFPSGVVDQMGTNAGFFPTNGESLDAFSRLMLKDVAECDVLGIWFNDFEDEICNRFAPKADLVELGCLEPFHYAEPWSQHL